VKVDNVLFTGLNSSHHYDDWKTMATLFLSKKKHIFKVILIIIIKNFTRTLKTPTNQPINQNTQK